MATSEDKDVSDLVAKMRTLQTRLRGVEQEYFLVSSDNTRLQISHKNLISCPFFENLLNEDPKLREVPTHASQNATKILHEFLETGRVQTKVPDAFELLVVGRSLKWPAFSAVCAAAARGIDAPTDADAASVRGVAEDLIKYLPLRMFEHYDLLFKMIESATALDAEAKGDVLDSLVQVVTAKAPEEFKLLQIPLFAKEITVAMMKDLFDNNMVVYLNLKKKAWEPVDLFGPRFCPFEAGAIGFHLCFGKYVIFRKDDTSVLKKDLRSNEPAQVLFETSKFFRSRINQLHVICAEQKGDVVYEWNADTDNFYRRLDIVPGWRLRSAHNDANGKLVVARQDVNKCFRFTGSTLDSVEKGVVDRLGEWTKNAANSTVFSRIYYYKDIILRTGTWEINDCAHFGYSTVESQVVDSALVQCKFYIEQSENAMPRFQTLPYHGPVQAISDVFLGVPTISK